NDVVVVQEPVAEQTAVAAARAAAAPGLERLGLEAVQQRDDAEAPVAFYREAHQAERVLAHGAHDVRAAEPPAAGQQRAVGHAVGDGGGGGGAEAGRGVAVRRVPDERARAGGQRTDADDRVRGAQRPAADRRSEGCAPHRYEPGAAIEADQPDAPAAPNEKLL